MKYLKTDFDHFMYNTHKVIHIEITVEPLFKIF